MSYSSFSNNFGQSSVASDLGAGAGSAAGALTLSLIHISEPTRPY